MAREEKDASKIGRMEGSEEDNGKVSQDGDGFHVGRFLMDAF